MNSRRVRLCVAALFAAQLASCANDVKPTKEEEEAAKATFVCLLNGDKLILRFEPGEVRLLTATAERITLYQIPAAAGVVRYNNATLELRGKGMDLALIDNGVSTLLVDCKPYVAPKPPA